MIASLALSALLLGATPAGDGQAPGAGAIHLVQDAPAPPVATTPRSRRPAQRRAARRRAPPPVAEAPPPPPPAPAPQADIAPMPNRSVEAPRPPPTREAARLRPDLIEPRNLPDSRVQSGNNYTERQDRLFRDPAAGARLEIPFSY
ncbi:hypothetical protein [Muricoccus pecuniae]|uniref:Uncharacterized protein n=1 Tax=Muricoccus pecuniae TaxID=693023 RepID=A0A840YIW8_9PROT|nr:hypothetical protein [Roseomonas pecuniae]MBB5694033.1 hypothetical protein [Roseomonas pecuniae]